MNKTITRIVLAVTIITFIFSCRNDHSVYHQNLQNLVEAERSFARLSADTGMRTAFTHWLADEAVVFRPEPVRGKERYANSPDVPGMLIWQPTFADISAAGDLGYTSGPYEFRKEGSGHAADSYGHYVSIWQKQLNGTWRVLIDVGISHPAFDYDLQDTILEVSNPKSKSVTSASTYTFSVSKLDITFSNTASISGYRQALKEHSSSAVRIYREEHFPFIGIGALGKEVTGQSKWSPVSGDIARSGDLGYSYGIASAGEGEADSEKSSYLRIWKRQAGGAWKLVLEITNPIPE